jgi:hypothetical protein
MLSRNAGIDIHRLPGRHHLHLEGAAGDIAIRVAQFLAAR